jgi:hypothetical protein
MKTTELEIKVPDPFRLSESKTLATREAVKDSWKGFPRTVDGLR